MAGFESRFERLELKYVIDELTAERVRRAITPYCEPDPHNLAPSGLQRRPGRLGYAIHSLYLDSPGLAFHEAKERGDPERLKLRIRTYPRHSPAVLELKRKVADVIDKTRVVVDRKLAEEAARGLAPARDDTPEARRFLNRFGLIVAKAGAGPTLHVRYEREAYSSVVDEYARVTFDRRIAAQRASSWDLEPDPRRWCEFDDHWLPEYRNGSVVLELKCQSSIPYWITDLVQQHSLSRRSFSKYSTGIYLTGRSEGRFLLPTRSAKVMM